MEKCVTVDVGTRGGTVRSLCAEECVPPWPFGAPVTALLEFDVYVDV